MVHTCVVHMWLLNNFCYSIGPPSSPRLILGSAGSPRRNGDTITICWLPALDPGGLSDLRYNIYVYDTSVDDPTFERANPSEGIVQGAGDDQTQICYDVEVSDTGSSYGIIVVSSNGATSVTDTQVLMNVEDVQDRSVTFFVTPSALASCNRKPVIMVPRGASTWYDKLA